MKRVAELIDADTGEVLAHGKVVENGPRITTTFDCPAHVKPGQLVRFRLRTVDGD